MAYALGVSIYGDCRVTFELANLTKPKSRRRNTHFEIYIAIIMRRTFCHCRVFLEQKLDCLRVLWALIPQYASYFNQEQDEEILDSREYVCSMP